MSDGLNFNSSKSSLTRFSANEVHLFVSCSVGDEGVVWSHVTSTISLTMSRTILDANSERFGLPVGRDD